MACRRVTLPLASPSKRTVLRLHSRVPPSSCELSVRSCSGHSGHGVCGARVSGGLGMISNWRTLAAPWRKTGAKAVGAGIATADDDNALAGGKDRHARREPCRPARAWSAAAGTPSRSGCPSAHARDIADRAAAPSRRPARWHRIRLRRSVHIHVHADMRVGDKLHALGLHLLQAAIDDVLLQLEVRDAVAQQAADAVGFFIHGDGVSGAAQLLRRGKTRRTGADHGNLFAASFPGGSGRIQPSSHPRSTMVFSICLMVTGGWLIPSTQAASQGAGQMRPVNSGKLLVACRRRTLLPSVRDKPDHSSRECDC